VDRKFFRGGGKGALQLTFRGKGNRNQTEGYYGQITEVLSPGRHKENEYKLRREGTSKVVHSKEEGGKRLKGDLLGEREEREKNGTKRGLFNGTVRVESSSGRQFGIVATE